MGRRVFRVIRCACGEEVIPLLGDLAPVECECGMDYDPKTGELLPVCDGFEVSA